MAPRDPGERAAGGAVRHLVRAVEQYETALAELNEHILQCEVRSAQGKGRRGVAVPKGEKKNELRERERERNSKWVASREGESIRKALDKDGSIGTFCICYRKVVLKAWLSTSPSSQA